MSSNERTIELIATVSHEIRSPLTTIKGFTKTLLDRWDRLEDEMKLEMLAAINADADRVTRILTELLDVSRLEAGKLTLHLRPVDICVLVEEVAEALADRSDKHTIVLDKPADGEHLEVVADPDKVRQVLANLIENAQKYADEGTITVSCSVEDGFGTFSVTDMGPGVPPDLESKIFEKFSRRELPGSPTGTGLGLYISKGLIEAQGGQIGATFESSESRFWFRLPLAERH
ncbi:MAG: ATP-binding protein [Actinomycetota bacterium]